MCACLPAGMQGSNNLTDTDRDYNNFIQITMFHDSFCSKEATSEVWKISLHQYRMHYIWQHNHRATCRIWKQLQATSMLLLSGRFSNRATRNLSWRWVHHFIILFAVKKKPFRCTNTECPAYDRVPVLGAIGKDGKITPCIYCQEDSLTELPTSSPGK